MSLAKDLFTEIFDHLVLYHALNEAVIVDKQQVNEEMIHKLKELLMMEQIYFTENESQLICRLTEKRKANVEKLYTPEVVKELEEEKLRPYYSWLNDDYLGY